MNSNRSIFIIAGAIVLLIGVYFILTNSNTHSWYESYKSDDKEPYGEYVLIELLKDFAPKKQINILKSPIRKSLKSDQTEANYIFIGEDLAIDSLSRKKLLKFVKNGNNAFIATKYIPYALVRTLHPMSCDDEENEDWEGGYLHDTIAQLNFSHPELKTKKDYNYQHVYRNEIKSYSWNYLDSGAFCTQELNVTTIGTLNDSLINFYRIKHGKGNFYFHTNPIVFTNYHLLERKGREYAEKTFSHLNDGAIYWDEYSKMPTYNSGTERSRSPLTFILSESSLRTGWYLVLILVLIYVVFFAKRKQRIIPVLAPNINSSIEFTETMGRLYFQNNNHKKLCIQKMKLFLTYIRDRYHISTNVVNQGLIQKISLKSKIPSDKVEIIFMQYKRIDSLGDTAEDTLINFHQAIEYFYQNSK